MASSINKYFYATCVVALSTLSGCSTDKIVGRYHTAECETVALGPSPSSYAIPTNVVPTAGAVVDCNSIVPMASAYASSIPTPPKSAPDGTAFPERAEAAYIGEMAKFAKSSKDLRAALAGSIKSSEDATSVVDRSVFHRTLIVGVRKDGPFSPADRLEATDVIIRPCKARFDAWDSLTTNYTTINAGTLQLTQVRGATENLTVGAPTGAPISGSLSIGGSQTDTRAENISALSQVESVTATVEDGALRIHRQGGYGIDLTGSTVMKVDISYTGDQTCADDEEQYNPGSTYLFAGPDTYQDAQGHWLPANAVVLKPRRQVVVPPGEDIHADVYLTYTVRHAKAGGDTYEEKDDDILERTVGPVRNRVTIVPTWQASVAGYGVAIKDGSNKDFTVEFLQPGRDPVILCFDTYDNALDFLSYMKVANLAHPNDIGNGTLGVSRPDLDPDKAPFLPLTSQELASSEIEGKCI